MANPPSGATTAAASTNDDEAKKQAQEKKAQERKEQEKRDAVQQLRERQQQNNAAEHYKDLHFWTYWKRVDKQPNEVDPHTGELSSVPGERTLLEPGTYQKRGANLRRRTPPYDSPILAHFDYDSETKRFTVQIDIREYTSVWQRMSPDVKREANHKKWEPTPGNISDFDKHAEITGREQVRFLAGKPNCFSKIYLTFNDIPNERGGKSPHPFLTGRGGNIGSNTLAYAEKQVKAALEEALIQGVGFEVSSNFLQAVYDKRGSHERAWYDSEIAKANANGDMRKLIDGFVGPEALQQHQKALQGTDSISQSDRDQFKKEVDKAVEAQIKKVDDLQEKVDAAVDSAKQKALQTLLNEEKDRRGELLKDQQIIKSRADDPKIMSDKETLQQYRDKIFAEINPKQKFEDAVRELRTAIDEVAKDKSAYKTDSEKTQLNNIEKNIKELETKLGTDLTKAERDDVKANIDTLLANMRILSDSKSEFKTKCEAAIEKAEKYANGEKSEMDAAKRLDDRADKLEKAAAALHKAMEDYQKFNPKKLAPHEDPPGSGKKVPGMILERKPLLERRLWASRFIRIESEAQAQKYIDKRFNGMQQQRQDLQKMIEAEQKKLDDAAKKLPHVERDKIQVKLQEVQKQLDDITKAQKEIEDKKKAGAAPRGPGSTVSP